MSNLNSPTNQQTSSNSASSPHGSNEEVKVLFLGSSKVGKSSIIQRFLHNHFDPKYTPTIEDVHVQKFIIKNYLMKLILIDTSGGYDFPAMLRLCIAKAHAFVIVFAHDNIDSLHQASQFLSQIKTERKDYAPLTNNLNDPSNSQVFDWNLVSCAPPIVVVCNKSDLPNSQSQISEGVIMEWLLTNGLKPSQFVYSSAKSNEAILSIFEALWMQNSISKSIQLVPWNCERRRASLNNQQCVNINQILPNSINVNSNLKDVNFSTSSSPIPVSNRTSSSNAINFDINLNDGLANKPNKFKTSVFRNSLKLYRRSSNKLYKTKPDLIHLNCNTS